MVTVTVLPLEAAGCGSIMLLLPLFILFCKCWAVYSIASVQEQKMKCRCQNYWTVLKILVTCLATIAYVYCSYAVCVTILVLGGNFNQFWVLHSYTLLLKSPILMHSWKIKTILKCYCLMDCIAERRSSTVPSEFIDVSFGESQKSRAKLWNIPRAFQTLVRHSYMYYWATWSLVRGPHKSVYAAETRSLDWFQLPLSLVNQQVQVH